MKRIYTLGELVALRDQKRSVSFGDGPHERVRPAAFVLNLSGEMLHRMFIQGIYLYEPKTKRTRVAAGFQRELAELREMERAEASAKIEALVTHGIIREMVGKNRTRKARAS